jgi:hypothetical protein
MKKVNLALLVLILVSSFSIGYANATGNPVSNNCPGNSCHGGNGGNGGDGGAGGNSSSSAVGTGGNATGGSAIAVGGSSNTDVRNSNTINNGNANSNRVDSTNIQGQGQQQGQGQGQGQSQSTANANNAQQSSSVTIEGDNFEARRIPVSTAYANAPMPSATCRAGGALGVQSTVLGISFGGDRAVDTCEINEAARIAFATGHKDMATEILCQNKWAKKTAECKALVAAE